MTAHDARTDQPALPLAWRLAVLFAALLILVVRHRMSFDTAVLGHVDNLFTDLVAIDGGQLWVEGPHFGESGIQLGGPMYAWLHLPGRLLTNPVLGLLVTYAGYQALAVLLAVLASARGQLRGALLASALFLAADTRVLEPFVENSTLAALWACIGFVLLLATLTRPGLGWAVAAGGALMAAFLVHHLTAIGLVAAGVGLLALRDGRARRLLAFAGGAAGIFLLCSPGMRVGEGRVEGEPTIPADVAAQVLDGLFSSQLLGALWSMALEGWLLVPVGLVVAVFQLRRKREARPALLAALAWIVLAGGLTCVALAQRVGAAPEDTRELLTGVERMMHASAPARALLMGLAAWTVLGWLGQRLKRPWLTPATLVLLLLVTTGVDYAGFVPRSPFQGGPVARLYDYYQGDEHNVRDAFQYHQHLGVLGVHRLHPDAVHSNDLAPRLAARWPVLARQQGAPGPDDHTVLIPPYDRWDQLSFVGAESFGLAGGHPGLHTPRGRGTGRLPDVQLARWAHR